MRNLSTETYDAVVEALLPHMTNEDERRTELLPVLSRRKYSRIDWSGSSHSFTVRLVGRLSRSDLIAILERLRVGDEQHEALEQLCMRVRHERRLTGARLRQAGTWTRLGVFVAGVAFAVPLTWWLGRDDASVSETGAELDSSVDGPPPSGDSIAAPDPITAPDPIAAPEPSTATNIAPATPPAIDTDTEGDAHANPDTEQSTPAQPAVVERSRSRVGKSAATKPEPQHRDCKAIAKELAQVLTNDAPRPGQCDEDGFMRVRIGADGLVTTSGPLRDYPVEDGQSCGGISVKCPANW